MDMPNKIGHKTFDCSSSICCDKDTSLSTTVSSTPYAAILKRVAEVEEKISILEEQHMLMPLDKREMLDASVSRIDALETDLAKTKKDLEEYLARQEELLCYIDEKMNRLNSCCWQCRKRNITASKVIS